MQSKGLLNASTRPQVLHTQLIDATAVRGDLNDLLNKVLGHTHHAVHIAQQNIARMHRYGRKHGLALSIQRHGRIGNDQRHLHLTRTRKWRLTQNRMTPCKDRKPSIAVLSKIAAPPINHDTLDT